MHSFLQTKKISRTTKSSPKREPLAEVKSADQLSGKFKLSTWSRKSAKKRCPVVKEETSEAGSPYLDAGLVSRKLNAFGECLANSTQSLSIDTTNAYSSLPISIQSPRTQRLLYYCQHSLFSSGAQSFARTYTLDLANCLTLDNTGCTLNAFAMNYDNAWKPSSISDAALLHATLCLVAQHEDLLQGAEDSSTSLYHKGQVMKLINERLIDDPKNLTDASVTSIALLVILEV
jgi:hypothetical protein